MSKNYFVSGQAFPVVVSKEHDALYPDHGMTLFEYFAGQAVAGQCAGLKPDFIFDPDQIAGRAFLIAEAMMQHREKRMKEQANER